MKKLKYAPTPWHESIFGHEVSIYHKKRIICTIHKDNQYPLNSKLIINAPKMFNTLIEEWKFLEHFLACYADTLSKEFYTAFLNRQDIIKNQIEEITGFLWEEITKDE